MRIATGLLAAITLTLATPGLAEAKQPAPHCRVLSTVTTMHPGGVVYNPDGTSESLTKYTETTTMRCRGKVTTRTITWVGY